MIRVPFLKRKKGRGYVPTREVLELRDRGYGDREIIDELSKRGFSYDEIEQAMLQSLKSDVTATRVPIEAPTPPATPAAPAHRAAIGAPTTPAPTGVAPEATLPEIEATEEIAPPERSAPSPEITIEEIVEGVVDEKIEPFKKELRSLRDEIGRTLKRLKELELKTPSGEEINLEEKLAPILERLSKLEGKVEALERTLRDLLPQIIANVRRLAEVLTKE